MSLIDFDPAALDPAALDPAALDDSAPLLSVLPLALAARRRGVRLIDAARTAASSTPANPVAQPRSTPGSPDSPDSPGTGPDASPGPAGPAAGALTGGYDRALASYRQQLTQALREPDYGDVAKAARERGNNAVALMAASLAAGMGPQDMHPLQSAYAEMGQNLLRAQKIEGGEIDAAGNVSIDPGYKRQKQIESLRDDIAQLERLKLTAVTADDKRRAEQLQHEATNALRELMLRGQQQHQQAMEAIARGNLEARREAAQDRAAAVNAPLSPKDRYAVEDRMGDDFRNETKSYRDALDATGRIAALPSTNERPLNTQEQNALVYLLNKFLDPSSVVREGEYDRTVQQQGYLQRALMLLPKLERGEFLPPAQIAQIRDMAALFERANRGKLDTVASAYIERAKRRHVDPFNVVGQYAPSTQPPRVAVPPAAAAALQRDPGRRAEFDAKYGAGAAVQVLGQ